MEKWPAILGTGSYLPAQILKNEDLTQFPASRLPLIAEKTGILQRHYASSEQATSDLAAEAGRAALAAAGVSASELDGIICATSSPDRPQPATATRVASLLGATRAWAFDVNSVCSGAIFALASAGAMVRAGTAGKVLVVAAEIYSRILNPKDFSTCPYFGDGAGACVLGLPLRGSDLVFRDFVGLSDGSNADTIEVHAGGSLCPITPETAIRDRCFKMNGQAVYQYATQAGETAVRALLERQQRKPLEVDLFVSHQANINIIQEIAQRLEVPTERFFTNLDRYGNTAAASVLIALDEALRARAAAQIGTERAVLVAFGGGLTWGAAYLERWNNHD